MSVTHAALLQSFRKHTRARVHGIRMRLERAGSEREADTERFGEGDENPRHASRERGRGEAGAFMLDRLCLDS